MSLLVSLSHFVKLHHELLCYLLSELFIYLETRRYGHLALILAQPNYFYTYELYEIYTYYIFYAFDPKKLRIFITILLFDADLLKNFIIEEKSLIDNLILIRILFNNRILTLINVLFLQLYQILLFKFVYLFIYVKLNTKKLIYFYTPINSYLTVYILFLKD